MTVFEVQCDHCGYESTFTDHNSPIEEIAVLYFQGGWKIGEITLCPDCSSAAKVK